ncbi:MAG: hypothetical protein DME90_10235 [Verrucomicrobia bacterium]|nr:MAG: hypothetical protein DME90_10235 [Verrucomicrobiota bacterium]
MVAAVALSHYHRCRIVEEKRDHEQKRTLKEARFNSRLNLFFHIRYPCFFIVEFGFEAFLKNAQTCLLGTLM